MPHPFVMRSNEPYLSSPLVRWTQVLFHPFSIFPPYVPMELNLFLECFLSRQALLTLIHPLRRVYSVPKDEHAERAVAAQCAGLFSEQELQGRKRSASSQRQHHSVKKALQSIFQSGNTKTKS
eukprot:TRINITY_DN12471_c0_g1_i1.p1 TRINITY_DN12471_c0_g1~~TRINITY_DN12471_c0_g1_i1.p1  ORF type:complete len:134 (-),score=30.96 TRINITY_DN12471_c0_g1_i1:1-369(-)